MHTEFLDKIALPFILATDHEIFKGVLEWHAGLDSLSSGADLSPQW